MSSHWGESASSPAGDDASGLLQHLVVTASRDGIVRAWTLEGRYIGSFGRDQWQVETASSYATPPAVVTAEPPRIWEAPPWSKCGGEDVKTSVFLTAIGLEGKPGSEACGEQAHEACGGATSGDVSGDEVEIDELLPPPPSMGQRERFLEYRAQAGVQRAIGTMHVASMSGLSLGGRHGAALRQVSSEPLLPPLEPHVIQPLLPPLEGAIEDDSLDLERAHARARSKLAAKVTAHREHGSFYLQTTATDSFLGAREKAARVTRGQPRKLPVHALTPIRRREPRRERGVFSLR